MRLGGLLRKFPEVECASRLGPLPRLSSAAAPGHVCEEWGRHSSNHYDNWWPHDATKRSPGPQTSATSVHWTQRATVTVKGPLKKTAVPPQRRQTLPPKPACSPASVHWTQSATATVRGSIKNQPCPTTSPNAPPEAQSQRSVGPLDPTRARKNRNAPTRATTSQANHKKKTRTRQAAHKNAPSQPQEKK